ncbi:MAG: cache domain-containing protein [Colwellia sp.]|nr:cache domain-containing protein [Colwellia sp.]
MAHNIKLLRLIKIIPPVIVTMFACLVIVIVFNHNQTQLKHDIETLHQDFITSKKEMIKAQVKQLVQQISYEKNSTETILKNNIKDHIYQAHAIASSIYQHNKEKTESEVTQLITTALREIRFNQGRGYVFIYKTNGLSIMHPVVPAMEGSIKIDLQDVRGNYIVRELGQLAKKNGEAFYHWWFVKPNLNSAMTNSNATTNIGQEFEKIGFGKYFAPYDWFIGTGEYLIDVENDSKQRLIKRIANIRYGINGYVFLLDTQGNVLSHLKPDFQGTNLLNHHNANVVAVSEQIIAIANKGEGFLEYLSPFMPNSENPGQKISFIQGVAQWNWAIGVGFYESETEKYLIKRKLIFAEQNKHQLISLLSLSIVVTLFFITLSLFLTKYLAKRFTLYENRINKDFTELNKVKVQSQYQALHDSLTTLPNRILLDEHIKQGILSSRKNNKSLAVVFVDLDDFKKTNDLYGHSVGDALLQHLGDSFNKLLEKSDSVARFGGDEFIFNFPELSSQAEAEHKVKAIQQIFDQEFIIKNKSIYSSCSIGVAMFPKDGENSEELISKADIALYKSKSEQKGRSLFFNESINKQVKRDFLIESELRLALAEKELTVHYQPQISVETGEILGVEALIRWQNKILGFVSPAEFIQVAENIGIISDIGAFVIERALRDIMQFNLKNAYDLHLSINISPKQLMEPFFAESVVNMINKVAFKPNLITLEITENVLISDLSKVQPVLQHLRDQGFKLSLDDFGTGYSSLSYLSNLPMNEIKIDRSFIDKFLTNAQSESLVKTIIAIGQFCHLTVVAEGVETKEQYERLVLYHCDLIQGYYFDKALTINDLTTKYQLDHVGAFEHQNK